MKTICILLCSLMLSFQALAGEPVVLQRGLLETTNGIGDYVELGYALAAGDRIHIRAHASKELERVLVIVYPENVIGRVLLTKSVDTSFVVPEEGIVVIRFISNRQGRNRINYTISREAGSDATRSYNTDVVWEKPANGRGLRVPRRAAAGQTR